MPVKYASGVKVKISSVPGSKGIALAGNVVVAFVVAKALVVPTPKNTNAVPALMTRY